MIRVTIRRPKKHDYVVELSKKPEHTIWAQEPESTLILVVTGADVDLVYEKLLNLPRPLFAPDQVPSVVFTGDSAAFVLNNFWS